MDAAPDKDSASLRLDRLLTTLERLLELPATEQSTTLNQAAQLVAEVLGADKVDLFFHEAAEETLLAVGTSDTPMGQLQRAIGLDRLPLANGGRTVEVFLNGASYVSGHVDLDPGELVGIRIGLGVKSQMATIFQVQGQHRGVLLATSASAEFFSELDLRFLEAVAHWIGIVISRTELVERKRHEAVEQGRRLAAEELVTLMAHSLRNYLTPLRGRIELIERRAKRQEREQDLHDILAANNTLSHIQQVISDLLDVARLNQGTFVVNHELLNLVDLVQEVVPAFGSEAVPIYVHAPADLFLSADRNRMRMVLEHLLTTMVKYTPKGDPIQVEIHSDQQADGLWVILTIYNQASSIPPEVLERLFHPFGSDSPSTDLGLGLYLAQRIVEAHTGTLTVRSSAGQGVQMILSLPVEEDDVSVRE